MLHLSAVPGPRHRIRKTKIPPVAAEIVVFIATCAAIAPAEALDMPKVEPGLKPYQPHLALVS